MSARALVVTGADGWVGHWVVDRWRAGHFGDRHLVTFDLPSVPGATPPVFPGTESIPVDLTDAHAVRRAVTDVAARYQRVDVVHLAGVIHPVGLMDLAMNPDSTRHLVDAFGASGVLGRFVYLSSTAAAGTAEVTDGPQMAYGRAKRAAEAVLVAAPVDYTIVRAPWFYGPNHPDRQQRFLHACTAGLFPIPTRPTRRSLVEVRALAEALVLALDHTTMSPDGALIPTFGHRIVAACDPRAYSIRDVVTAVRHAAALEGRPLSKRTGIPFPTMLTRLAEVGDIALQRTGRYSSELHVLAELGRHIVDDPSVLIDAGWDPGPGLVAGMRASLSTTSSHPSFRS